MNPLALALAVVLLSGCSTATMQRPGATSDDRRIAEAGCEWDARLELNAPPRPLEPRRPTGAELAAHLTLTGVGVAAHLAGLPFVPFYAVDPIETQEAGVRSRTWRCMRAGGWR